MWLIKFIFLFCSIIYVSSSDLCSVCGQLQVQPRIFDGTPSKYGPWSVYLDYDYNDSTYICTGTIIDFQHILTAAHCFENNRYSSSSAKAKTLSVYAGDLIKKGEHAQVLKVESVFLHPKYNYTYGDVNSIDDLAIVKLQQPIEISKRLRPICLGNIRFRSNEIGVFQGYGHLSDQKFSYKDSAKQLYEASLRIQSNESCRKVYDYMYTPDHLCAFNGTKAGCPGDSGGGFFLTRRNRNYLIGITSFGGHCDNYPNSPLVFTRVSSYFQWIRNVTKVKDDCTPKRSKG